MHFSHIISTIYHFNISELLRSTYICIYWKGYCQRENILNYFKPSLSDFKNPLNIEIFKINKDNNPSLKEKKTSDQ